MSTPSPKDLVAQLLGILDRDREGRLKRIDRYIKGNHDDPYMPDSADAEYRLLAQRAVANVIPLLIGTPAQAMYVDGFRRGHAADVKGTDKRVSALAPEWEHWQFSHLDSRQTTITRSALGYGHAFTITLRERKRGNKAVTRGLSPLRTAAVFEDPANDIVPYAALTVDKWPTEGDPDRPGEGRLWNDTFQYTFTWKYGEEPKVGRGVRHGSKQCPVTRFAASVDLEGRTIGVAEPMIPLNDRINQTIFDLLVAQTGSSFKTRWATGMAPPLIRDEEGEVVLDENGQPMPVPISINAKKFLFGESPDIKFGTLDETPLDGYIKAIEAAFRHMAAISQTPPHHILGQIANLSAEALQAAEISLARKIEEFRKVFGESWERVFQIAAELDGDDDAANDWNGEVIWRDMDGRSLAQNADALGKLREMLGIPGRGLWHRVPGATQGELELWEELAEKEDPELLLAEALSRSTGGNPSRAAAHQRPAVPAE